MRNRIFSYLERKLNKMSEHKRIPKREGDGGITLIVIVIVFVALLAGMGISGSDRMRRLNEDVGFFHYAPAGAPEDSFCIPVAYTTVRNVYIPFGAISTINERHVYLNDRSSRMINKNESAALRRAYTQEPQPCAN